ncbi:MAG TPA: phosphotransferase, partial [Polyangiales bacterium]|nr:phosphotransferase [Polyangiales bacterium]
MPSDFEPLGATTPPAIAHELRAFYGGGVAGTLQALKGDASTRRYYRFVAQAPAPGLPAQLVVMHLPEGAETREAGRAQAESFVDVQRWLHARGIPVPAVHRAELDSGVMLLEDLGDEMFETRLRTRGEAAWTELYTQAIDLLAELHARCAPPQDPAACIMYRRTFEPKLLRWELDHFREWGLEAVLGTLAPSDRAELDAAFDALTASLVALPVGLVHRDYQSRNLMWAPDGGTGRLTVIDFQDAMMGPAPYDLVALLCDSYVTIELPLQLAMLERYASRRGFTPAQHAELVRGFRLISVQRKLKDAGR